MVALPLAPRPAGAGTAADPAPAGPRAVICGPVEHGDARGRLLGFPTANLSIDRPDVADGVWAALVTVDGTGPAVPAAVSIGRRTTFYGRHGQRLLEAHLLDVDRDLYGRLLEVRLHRRLRPQRRFDGVDALTEQMHRDVRATRDWARTVAGPGRAQR